MWSFAMPWAFVLLPLPFLATYLLRPAAQQGAAMRTPQSIVDRFPKSTGIAQAQQGLKFLLPWLVWIPLAVALAGPRITVETPALPASSRDIILALDLSGSMEKDDFELDGRPARRIDVVKRVAAQFVRGRAGDNVGLVIFSEKAYFAAAPTFDVEAVARAIEQAKIGISGKSTAISDGLGLALKRLSESKAASRVVILLSDGVNNAGAVKPADAANLARKLGVKVHTIAMGKLDLEGNAGDPDVVDTVALRTIASASGGEAFRVKATADLDAVARSIDAMETTEIAVPTALVFRDYWIWPALFAFACIALLLIDPRRLA